MKKIMFVLMLSTSAAISQNVPETTINVPEGRVFLKGESATFMGGPGFGNSQAKIESHKGDIVKVYWAVDGVSRCYSLKSRALVNC